MREPADLQTPRQREYHERKRDIAYTRVMIVDALMSAKVAQDLGDLDTAQEYADRVAELADDLGALLADWRADFPECYGDRPDRVSLS